MKKREEKIHKMSVSDILEQMSTNTYQFIDQDRNYSIENPFESELSQDEHKDDFVMGDVADFFENVEEADVDPEYRSLNNRLISASISGNFEECQHLTTHPQFDLFVNLSDHCGLTAVNYATNNGHTNIVELLTQNGALPDTKSITDFFRFVDTNGIVSKDSIREIDQVDRIKALRKESTFSEMAPPIPKVTVKKTSTTKKTSSFSENMKRNFAKSGFSEDRKTVERVPQGEEIDTTKMEEILSTHQKIGESFTSINAKIIELYSGRNVTGLLISEDKIDAAIVNHRNLMLPEMKDKETLFTEVKNVIRLQITKIGSKKLRFITDEIYQIISFYRDVYKRMIDFNRVYIKKSRIHGRGVFALKPIKKGDIITFYFPYLVEYIHKFEEEEGFVITPIISRRKFGGKIEELDNLRKSAIRLSNDAVMIGDDEYYGDTRFVGHMVNDPCDFRSGLITSADYESEIKAKSNATLIRYNEDVRFIYLVANRDIVKDEEILVPYGCNYWEISK